MGKLTLDIISPEESLFRGEVDSVSLPGGQTPFTVLPGHAAIISSLERGVVKYSVSGETVAIEIASGFVKVENDIVNVCIEK